MSPLQCCELLTKSQVFQKESATIAEESQDHTYKELHDVYHASLLSHSACGQQLCILLKSQTDRILANDSFGVVKVSVAEVRVEHEVKLRDFTAWLERSGRSPREIIERQKIRAI